MPGGGGGGGTPLYGLYWYVQAQRVGFFRHFGHFLHSSLEFVFYLEATSLSCNLPGAHLERATSIQRL